MPGSVQLIWGTSRCGWQAPPTTATKVGWALSSNEAQASAKEGNRLVVAVNDQRVVPTTSFFYAGVNILVNTASRLTGPYQVTAIGDPPALEAGLADSNHLAELKSRSRIYRLGFSWLRSPRLSLPAFDTTFLVKYAQPLG